MRIGIFGAGAIGCYLGARLADSGQEIRFVGRKRLMDSVADSGLHYESLEGVRVRVEDAHLQFSEEAEILRECDLVLVTVKSAQSEEAARCLAKVVADSCVLVSFQNGLGNTEIIKNLLPNNPVLAGIVPFNVLWQEPALFRQGTSGPLLLEDTHRAAADLAKEFEKAGLPIKRVREIRPLQWGKLLMNLNNAINALSGQPLQAQLANRGYRVVLAMALGEALGLLRRADLPVSSPLKVPLSLVPYVLRSPTPVFTKIARAMMKVAPDARSSMWEDLERGRKTEVGYLNGEVVALAERMGEQAPVNAAIVRLILSAEESGGGSPRLSAKALRSAIGR